MCSATGFTTRSDIGPAREAPAPSFGEAPTGYIAGRGRGAIGFGPKDDDDEGAAAHQQPSRDGEERSLFTNTVYEKDDEEADAVWEFVDDRMDERRRKRREEREKQDLAEYRAKRPKIQSLFADVKKDLASVSVEEWKGITEIGDRSLRYKQKKAERYTPVPEKLLQEAVAQTQQYGFIPRSGLDTPSTPVPSMTPFSANRSSGIFGALTAAAATTPLSGTATPSGSITAVGQGRQSILNSQLEKAAGSTPGTKTATMDRDGYLTDLSSIKINTEAEIGDMKKAEMLLKSVTNSNPKNGPGWISYALLLEKAGKIIEARKVIMQGCDFCPTTEDVWLEAGRLHPPDQAMKILTRALESLPNSVKLWIEAANLERDVTRKKRVLRKALEVISNSPKLWKVAISLETPDDARVLLARAVECVPHSPEMWLALARLETYDKAKQVLNRAHHAIPTERIILIAAAQLEEANGNTRMVDIVIKKGIQLLSANGVVLQRDEWMQEAEKCESSGNILTCKAIVSAIIEHNVDVVDQLKTWKDEAASALGRNSIETARAIYKHAAAKYPGNVSLWKKMFKFEKLKGTTESMEAVIRDAVAACPKEKQLWLLFAKEKWSMGDVQGAREVIKEAYKNIPNSEDIWLAAARIEKESDEYDLARKLLMRAREFCDTARVWMKGAALERAVGEQHAELALLQDGLKKFPQNAKLWLMLAQLYERTQTIDQARKTYMEAVRQLPNCAPLWIGLARLEERLVGPSKARAILDQSKLKNPKNEDLWLESVRVEQRAGNAQVALSVLAKGLQEAPSSGILWAARIEIEPKPTRRARSFDALKANESDARIFLAVARVFWEDRKIDKARSWFQRTADTDADYGDAWANWYKFEVQHGTEDSKRAVVARAVAAEPRHGERWISVAKDPKNHKLTTEQILKLVATIV